MKKLILSLMALCVAVAIVAEPRAVGLRIGHNLELSYQEALNSNNVLQIDAGWTGMWGKNHGAGAVVTYNWVNDLSSGNWRSLVGFGVGGGYEYHHEWKLSKDYNIPGQLWSKGEYVPGKGAYVGIAGNVGIEYSFDAIPLALALSYRPLIGIDMGKDKIPGIEKFHIGYHTRGLWDVALAVRYLF